MKIVSVVGARPNFMKVAPFCRALKKYRNVKHVLVHTGQHYDVKMSERFFQELGIPKPDVNLGIGSGTHAEQVGRTMIEFEKVLKAEKPDWVVVLGDVNATCACSITAKKEHIKVAHIEAGLRSRDMDMPEEINRLVTDRLSDLLFTPDRLSNQNLKDEGVPASKIKFVGNIMIDTLERERGKAVKLDLDQIIKENLHCTPTPSAYTCHLADGEYIGMTMHRPSNVDSKDVLGPMIDFIVDEVAAKLPVVWAIHPRAKKRLEEFGLWKKVSGCPNMILVDPLGYHAMLRLNMGAKMFMTDSGGLQEECCVLGTPCMTMRWNTERPITLQENGGASILVGNNIKKLRAAFRKEMKSKRRPMRPPLWDGKTAERIVKIVTRVK